MLPGGSAQPPITPQSVSPALVSPAPMAHTEILPASAMKSPIHPDIAQAPLNWTQIPGTASVVAAAPDGSLWALSDQPIGPDKYIWHYASGSWTNISGLASQLTVASDGSLWALNSGGGIWHYSSGTWTTPGGGASKSITADSSGGIYVLSNGGSSADKAIWHYSSGAGWVQQGGSGTVLAANLDTSNFSGVGINAGGLYILNSTGAIWYENSNGTFSLIPGAASAIAPTTNGGVFVLGYPSSPSGNQVFYYDLNNPGWTAQSGSGLLSLSSNTSLYLTSASGAIYSAPFAATGPVSTATITAPGSASSTSVTLGTPVTIPLTIVEKDVNGKTITGTYATPVNLTNFNTTGTTLNVTTVPSSTTSVTLTYTGTTAFTGTRISAFVNGTRLSTVLVEGPCTLASGVSRGGFYPCDLQSAYSLAGSSASNGSGQTIGIVDAFDDPNAEADLAVYRSAFGLAPCTSGNGCFKKRAQDGSTNYPVADAGWAGEIALDLDMASAICPNCKILLVEANSNANSALYAAENEAVVLGATEISNSWGGLELNDPTLSEPFFNHPGIPITVSSGDDGYGVQYPASSQFVTAVGGTNLSAASNARGWTETVWGSSLGGTGSGAGSGCSSFITKPAWQKDTGCTKRMVADVSADADPNTGVWTYNTYQTFGWGIWGGTSAAAPIIAGVYAISGNASTVVYGSYPYLHSGSLNDITSGTNGTCDASTPYYCNAEVGYDGPTGLGTPSGASGSFIRPQGRGETGPPNLNSQNYHPGPSHRVCSAIVRPGFSTCFAIVRDDRE